MCNLIFLLFQACQCDEFGAVDNFCDMGQCMCKPGFGGEDCSECLPGSYKTTCK